MKKFFLAAFAALFSLTCLADDYYLNVIANATDSYATASLKKISFEWLSPLPTVPAPPTPFLPSLRCTSAARRLASAASATTSLLLGTARHFPSTDSKAKFKFISQAAHS